MYNSGVMISISIPIPADLENEPTMVTNPNSPPPITPAPKRKLISLDVMNVLKEKSNKELKKLLPALTISVPSVFAIKPSCFFWMPRILLRPCSRTRLVRQSLSNDGFVPPGCAYIWIISSQTIEVPKNTKADFDCIDLIRRIITHFKRGPV
jgi:hypothetical protein